MKAVRGFARIVLAPAFLLMGAHATWAQPVTGCPAGQAMQSSDPSGRNVTCVAIADVSALQAQMKAEADSRAGMDALLLEAIADEAKARGNADAELRASINEKDIIGRYAFSGPLTCLQSSNGFNADLTPKAAAPGLPNPFETQVSFFTTVASGIRTFNADQTGTLEVVNHSLTLPLIRYPAGSLTPVIGFGGPNLLPGGNASEVTQSATFAWHIADGKVVIIEGRAKGTITKGGGTRTGWTVENFNLPNSVGMLSKDLKTLSLVNEDLQVETAVQTSPEGVAQPESYRICTRHRVLTKL
jgi:hypothetical protein